MSFDCECKVLGGCEVQRKRFEGNAPMCGGDFSSHIPTVHIIANLPASAPEYMDAFRKIFSKDKWAGAVSSRQLPRTPHPTPPTPYPTPDIRLLVSARLSRGVLCRACLADAQLDACAVLCFAVRCCALLCSAANDVRVCIGQSCSYIYAHEASVDHTPQP